MVFGNTNTPQHSDDYFADSRMSFGDHIEELRLYLWRAIAGFGVAMVLCFFVSRTVLTELIIAPVESKLIEFWQRRVDRIRTEELAKLRANGEEDPFKIQYLRTSMPRRQAAALLQGADLPPIDDPARLEEGDWVTFLLRVQPLDLAEVISAPLAAISPKPSMKTMNVTEAFMVYFKVSIACGFVLGSPWIFWQLWMFVAAGLYPHEKRYVYMYLPFSIILFLTGAAVCQFLVLPKAVEALLWFNEWLALDPDLRLNEWLSFAIWMPIVFGIAFQTPLVMLLLYRVGIVDVETYREKRKMAFFVLALVSAVFTPSIDAVSMFFLWGPLCVLYQGGIWLCQWSPRPEFGMDEADSDELVGV